MTRVPTWPVAVLLAGLSVVGAAKADVVVTITGNIAVAEITLPNAAAPLYTATLRLEFDEPENLSVLNLGIEAQIIDPASLLPRLPASTMIPAEFPVLVRVEPPQGAQLLNSSFELAEPGSDELGFRRSVVMELRTVHLPFDPNRPLRLLRAPLGGNFLDLTNNVLPGSARASARSGGFSEFVIVDEMRTLEVQAIDRFVRLDQLLGDPVIDPDTGSVLRNALTQCRKRFDNQQYPEALKSLAVFDGLIVVTSPEQMPDRWRARRDLSNPRGEIEALSASLGFVLRQLAGD